MRQGRNIISPTFFILSPHPSSDKIREKKYEPNYIPMLSSFFEMDIIEFLKVALNLHLANHQLFKSNIMAVLPTLEQLNEVL